MESVGNDGESGNGRDWIMDKKYKLLQDNTISIGGTTLYRIQALRDTGDVKAGDLGGYIQSEDNLSHDGNAWVYDHGTVRGNGTVCDNGVVCDNGIVWGNGVVWGNALIRSGDDYLVLQGLGSANRTTTIMRSQDGGLLVSCGCFQGTLDEFAAKVKQTHGDNKYAKEYELCIELAKVHFGA